jgi:CRP/FNR family cyclic AMP-dependent transcriptional regulator
VSEAHRTPDIDLLARLKSLSWLSASQLRRLSSAISARDIARDQVIFIEDGHPLSDIYILLSGAARLSSTARFTGQRSVAMIAPGIILKLPAMPVHIGNHFRCQALRKSRIARVSHDAFIEIVLGPKATQFSQLAQSLYGGTGNLLARYPGFLGFDLRARIALALLELSTTFGASDARGVVLTITLTQQDLAGLVGASRPKISIILSEFARQRLIYRDGRRLIVVPSQLQNLAAGADL